MGIAPAKTCPTSRSRIRRRSKRQSTSSSTRRSSRSTRSSSRSMTFRAHLALLAEAGHFVQLNAGAAVRLGKVELDIQSVETQALLEVRLHEVTKILARVLTTLDRNPKLLKSVGEALGDVGGGAHDLLGDTGDVVKSAGKGSAAARSGRRAGSRTGRRRHRPGRPAGRRRSRPGRPAGRRGHRPGRQQGVEGVGQGAQQGLQGLTQPGQQANRRPAERRMRSR